MPADHQYPSGPSRLTIVVGRELPRATGADAARPPSTDHPRQRRPRRSRLRARARATRSWPPTSRRPSHRQRPSTPKIGYQRALVAETILVVRADGRARRRPRRPAGGARPAALGRRRVVDLPHQSTIDVRRREDPRRRRRARRARARRGRSSPRSTPSWPTAAGRGRRRRVAASAVARRCSRCTCAARTCSSTFGTGSGIDAVIAAAGGTDLGTAMGVVDNAELLRRNRSSPPPPTSSS